MGRLFYGETAYMIEVDDRALAHLKIVMLNKLRRGESFSFSWETAAEAGSGRSAIWLNPAIPLRFEFYGSRSPALNRAWIAHMLATSSQTGDLALSEETEDASGARTDSPLST